MTEFAQESASGLVAVVDAGAVDACMSVIDDEEIDPVAKVHALALLAELFDDDEIVLRYTSVEMIDKIVTHMEVETDNDELQALAVH